MLEIYVHSFIVVVRSSTARMALEADKFKRVQRQSRCSPARPVPSRDPSRSCGGKLIVPGFDVDGFVYVCLSS
jgi:hypothetical protein